MEFLSHLPLTSPSANPLRPTLFELIAQDQLRDLIQPALRYVIAVLPPVRLRCLLSSSMLNDILDISLNWQLGTMNYTLLSCSSSTATSS